MNEWMNELLASIFISKLRKFGYKIKRNSFLSLSFTSITWKNYTLYGWSI